MTWVRIHDGALSHPKLLKIFNPRNPFDLWVWGLSYVHTHLTDGVIPEQALPRTTKTAITRLIELRLWSPHQDGYAIHDYLQWNTSKADVFDKRTQAKERMKRVRGRTNGERSNEQDENVLKRSSIWMDGSLGSELPPSVISSDSLAQFDRVYAAYPNKERKEKANREWILLAPPPPVAQQILADIQRRVTAGWVRLERRFIPQLGTFLHDRMWEDDAEPGPIYDEPIGPTAWQCGACGEIHEGTSAQAKTRQCLKVTA